MGAKSRGDQGRKARVREGASERANDTYLKLNLHQGRKPVAEMSMLVRLYEPAAKLNV